MSLRESGDPLTDRRIALLQFGVVEPTTGPVTYMTSAWSDVGEAGIVWSRVERGVGLTVERVAHGTMCTGRVHSETMRVSLTAPTDRDSAMAWCDRWGDLMARELGR